MFMTARAAIEAPVGLSVGSDPPDRILTTPKGQLGVELTELTLESIRKELAPLRKYGFKLENRLNNEQSSFKHLIGRTLHLCFADFGNLKSHKLNSNTNEILKALANDIGVVGEDVVLTKEGGIPQTHRGFHGKIGQFLVQVFSGGIPENISLFCTIQSQVRLSEAVSALQKAIDKKDKPGNDVVLITCGFPNSDGFVCPLDQWLYSHIEEYRAQITTQIQPKNTKCVLLRMWNTDRSIELHRHPDATIPWKMM